MSASLLEESREAEKEEEADKEEGSDEALCEIVEQLELNDEAESEQEELREIRESDS
jgi:hypothetical protein